MVELVARVRATSKKGEKVALIADVLRQTRGKETELLALYLTGTLPQGRIGVGWKTLDRVPGPSQIRDSNGHTLVAQCARAGAQGRYPGPVPDEPSALRAAVEEALGGCDVLCLTGGVSMGERDHVPAVLLAAGVEPLFHRWSVKPGGPLWFGRRGDTLVFGLPGNPAATFVGFEVLVVPALRTRMGLPFAPRTTIEAAWDGDPPAPIARRQYLPVTLGFAGPVLTARAIPWVSTKASRR